MGFRCEMCGEHQPPRTKAEKRVVRVRRRIYPVRKEKRMTDEDYAPREVVTDKGGEGFEIVQEMILCPRCIGSGIIGKPEIDKK